VRQRGRERKRVSVYPIWYQFGDHRIWLQSKSERVCVDMIGAFAVYNERDAVSNWKRICNFCI